MDMSEVSVLGWGFSKMGVKTAIMVRFPFHLNWWSTWGLHQSLQIPQNTSEWAACPHLLWKEGVSSSRGSQSLLLRAMQPPYWLETGANVCWSTVLVWGCFSDSRSLYLNKTLWYWDVCAVMNSRSPKERLQREMKMPSGPSEKGAYLSPPLAFLLAKPCDSSLSNVQPLEPFLPECFSGKV